MEIAEHMIDSWALLIILVGGLGTLAIFSFLIKENPFYRLVEHLFIGISAGLGIVLPFKNFLWPEIFEPMLGFDRFQFPDGTFSKPYEPLLLLYLWPALFGLLFYTIFSRRFSWLAKLVIGFLLGTSGGAAFQGFFNITLPQLNKSFKPLIVITDEGFDLVTSFNNALFLFSLLAVMYYFFFSFRSNTRAMSGFAASGRWIMMVCFGAYFGSTVMARMALLVERLQFLIYDWRESVVTLVRIASNSISS